MRGVNAGGEGPWSNWRTDDSQITLVATTSVPEITLDHAEPHRRARQLDPVGRGLHLQSATQESHHRNIINLLETYGNYRRHPDNTEPAGWTRLSSGQSETSYTDNYTPTICRLPTDTDTAN